MGSWTNPPPAPRRAIRSLPPDARRPATATTSGVLRPAEHATRVALDRLPVAPALEPWLEHYWTVRWDLGDAPPFRSEVVPHPAMHLSVESGTTPHHGFAMPAALVHGVPTSRFVFDANGRGRVFGVKFRPGGFAAFTGAGAWTDRVVPAAEVWSDADETLAAVLAADTDRERATVMDAMLGQRLPEPAPRYERLLDVVAGMIADSTLATVADVCARHEMSERTLQRLFSHYVGVGPKWVLQRYRLHDAVTAIDGGEATDDDGLAGLAVRLGWYDQAHFTRDFAAQVGVPPATYLGRAGPRSRSNTVTGDQC